MSFLAPVDAGAGLQDYNTLEMRPPVEVAFGDELNDLGQEFRG